MGTRVAICACADADVAVFPGNVVRLYYQVIGPSREILSKSSTDNGLTWTQDPGVRISNGAFPSLLKMKDGKWRMYIQTSVGGVNGIGYSTSVDGLTWTAVSKIDLKVGGDSYPIDTVGGHSVLQLNDGTFLMTYIGTAGQAGSLFWATSQDGENWSKKGFIIDAREEIAKYRVGIDGSELVQWDSTLVKVYYRGASGIEVLNFLGDKFESKGRTLIPNAQDATGMAVVAGDPTLEFYGGRWHMFHGMGPKQNASAPDEGIYEASYVAASAPSSTPSPTPSAISSVAPSNTPSASSPSAIPQPVKSTAPTKVTITCVKGKTIKKITGVSPKCPPGFKVRK